MDAAVIGALVQAMASAIGTGIQGFSSKKNREFQAEQNQINRDYATQMTTAQWERDDSSLQRQVMDAQLAGLSPLAVTGAMNSSSPLNWVGQAPQMDLSNLIGMLSSSADSVANILAQKDINDSTNKQKALDRNANIIIETSKLNAQIEQWNKENELAESEQIDSMTRFNKQMLYEYDVLQADNEKFTYNDNLSRLSNISNQSVTQYQEVCESIGVTPKTTTTSNYTEYVDLLSSFWSQYSILALQRGTSNKSDQTSISNASDAGLGSNIVGIAGVNFKEGESKSVSADLERTNSFNDLSEYLSRTPFPIFVLKENDYNFNYKYNETKHYSKN